MTDNKQRQNILPKSPGRPKGSPNKTTGLLKDAILEAATNKGDGEGKNGLVGYLQWAAKEHPGPFIGLLGKVLPLTIAGDPRNPLVTLKSMTDDELEAIAASRSTGSSEKAKGPPILN